MRPRIFCGILLFFAAGLLMVNACKKTDINIGRKPATIEFRIPPNFPNPVFDFGAHPLTVEGIALGKKLFHDSRLAKFNDVNCGSCHQQHAAFTQFDHDLGHGTSHQHTTRNVPGIFNMVWQPIMQWDGSVPGLAEQPLACLSAPEKMAETPASVAGKLSNDTAYERLVSEAFGDNKISGDRILNALTQFVASIVSAESKYDKVLSGKAIFNESEQAGLEIFELKCASCHPPPLFTDFSFRNTGLEVNPFHPDYGRMNVTHNPADSLKFKVPSLRNVGFTGYYAHDGRFIDFSEMLTHYSEGVIQSPTLDPSLQNGIPLTNVEKFYLEEFLRTLDDSTLIADPRYGD